MPTYDAEGDVLYLHVGSPRVAEGEDTPEGHVLRFEPGTDQVVGLTLVNPRWLLDRDGRLIGTFAEKVEAGADVTYAIKVASRRRSSSPSRTPSCRLRIGTRESTSRCTRAPPSVVHPSVMSVWMVER